MKNNISIIKKEFKNYSRLHVTLKNKTQEQVKQSWAELLDYLEVNYDTAYLTAKPAFRKNKVVATFHVES